MPLIFDKHIRKDVIDSLHSIAHGDNPFTQDTGTKHIQKEPSGHPTAGPATNKSYLVPKSGPKRESFLEKLTDAIHGIESNFGHLKGQNPNHILGPKTKYGRAEGQYQMLPSTAKDYGVKNPFDPKQERQGAKKYLNHLLNLFGQDWRKAVAAYNSGEGTVLNFIKKHKGEFDINHFPFPETRKYIRITERYLENGILNRADAAEMEPHHDKWSYPTLKNPGFDAKVGLDFPNIDVPNFGYPTLKHPENDGNLNFPKITVPTMKNPNAQPDNGVKPGMSFPQINATVERPQPQPVAPPAPVQQQPIQPGNQVQPPPQSGVSGLVHDTVGLVHDAGNAVINKGNQIVGNGVQNLIQTTQEDGTRMMNKANAYIQQNFPQIHKDSGPVIRTGSTEDGLTVAQLNDGRVVFLNGPQAGQDFPDLEKSSTPTSTAYDGSASFE